MILIFNKCIYIYRWGISIEPQEPVNTDPEIIYHIDYILL